MEILITDPEGDKLRVIAHDKLGEVFISTCGSNETDENPIRLSSHDVDTLLHCLHEWRRMQPINTYDMPQPYSAKAERLKWEGYTLSSWGDEKPEQRLLDVYKKGAKRASIEYTGKEAQGESLFSIVRHN